MTSVADIPRENGSDVLMENGSDFPIDLDMDGDCDISMRDRSPSASSSSRNFSDASFILSLTGPEAQYTRWEIGYDMSAGDMHASWETLLGITDGSHSEDCPCRMDGMQERGSTEFMRYHRRKGEYGFFGLELRSPKYVGDAWQDDVRRTLEALHELFDDGRPRPRGGGNADGQVQAAAGVGQELYAAGDGV